jgi:signal transduction histidine kinase/CheY-like chemotaxis protein
MVEEGVIVLTGSDPFPEEDVRLLALVSPFIGVLLRNLDLCAEVEAAYNELQARRRETAHRERLEALGQLSSGIVHDVNNALSPITAFSSLLLSDAAEHGEETLRLLRLIYRAGNDVAEMLGRMRDFSRAREDERPMAPVDTATLLEEVVQLTGPRVRTASLLSGNEYNVVAEPVPGTRPVLGHDHELREALLNLVLNGIDALQNDLDAVLLVARPARREDDPGGDTRGFVAIEVADTGSGMSPDTLRRCMEPFFTTKGEEGTGLGMGQVKAVVQRHGGRLFVESEEGRGTRVRLLLPACSGMGLASGALEGEETPRLRVLAVDDDAVQRTVLEAVLRHQGHECTVVCGGRDAVEEFVRARQADRTYHVVITDLGMPDVDGRGVIRAVREVSPDARIILLTGWTAGIPGQGLPDGVDRLLTKPLRPEQLAEALQAISAPSEGEEPR